MFTNKPLDEQNDVLRQLDVFVVPLESQRRAHSNVCLAVPISHAPERRISPCNVIPHLCRDRREWVIMGIFDLLQNF